jgi:hypothetical protein
MDRSMARISASAGLQAVGNGHLCPKNKTASHK